MICNLCPRMCSAERKINENINGYCKMPLLPRVARAKLHHWEEPCISGTNGSGTVFFSGCSLNCVFCQNDKISHQGFGKTVSVERLADIFHELYKQGAHNINLVSPTHYVHAIKDALDLYKPPIPIVYNSGGYDRVESLKILEGYIDIYLMDFKYFSGNRALLYSGASNYPSVAQKAILEAYRQQSECIFDGEIMKKGLIVRHLLLPFGTSDAISVFDWVKNNTPNAYFSIMSQYLPMGKALKIPPLDRKVTRREYEKVLNYICGSDFTNCFYQNRSSATQEYIPPFDLDGV